MKLSTITRYGSRALVEIALVYPDGIISIKEVAERQNLSPKYLEQIMSRLKAAGLVRAVRSKHGGYGLAKSPASINLSMVYAALEGTTAPVDCVDNPDSCSMKDVCPTRDTWVELKESIEQILSNTTIQDLVERKKMKCNSSTSVYHI